MATNLDLATENLIIDGGRVSASMARSTSTILDGEVFTRVAGATSADVDRAVQSARGR